MVGFPEQISAGDPDSIWTAPPREETEVLGWLPPGSSLTRWQRTPVPLLASDGRYIAATADLLDITAAAAGGRYRVTAGSAPNGSGQVALTARAADLAGVGVGGTVRVGAPARTMIVSGIVEPAVGRNTTVVVSRPGTIPVLPSDVGGEPVRCLERSPSELTAATVIGLHAHGVEVYSRAAVLAQTGSPSATPETPADLLAVAAVGIIAVLGVLQVVFLTGPAFAVGARRMRRQLGQLTAAGAGPRQVRAVVLGSGFVLGLAGSTTRR